MLQAPSSLPTFTWLLICLFILVLYWKRSKAKGRIYKLPPGPWKLPILGNLHQLAFAKIPHRSLKELANKYGPILQLKLGEVLAIIITSPDLAEDVLKTHDPAFAERPSVLAVEILSYDYSSMVFSPYGEYWRQMRKVCVMELLSVKRVQSFRLMREEEVGNLVDFVSSSGEVLPIDLSEEIFSVTHRITCRAVFGNKCAYEKEFLNLLHDINKLAGGFDLPDLFPSLKFLGFLTGTRPKLLKIQRRMDKILENILNEHKMKRSTLSVASSKVESSGHVHHDDIIDMLLNLQAAGELEFNIADKHIKAIMMEVVSAGSETSATVIEWVMSELIMKNPTIREKAQAEVRRVFAGRRKIDETGVHKLDYLKSIVKETLRLHPPGGLLIRESREKREIGGYEIPSNTKIIVNAWAMGRNPDYWIDADCFRPERFLGSSVDFRGANFEFIPFGGGRRMCPGITFALASIELTLSHLLYHFDWKLPNEMKPQELDMSEAIGISVKKKNALYVIATPWSTPPTLPNQRHMQDQYR